MQEEQLIRLQKALESLEPREKAAFEHFQKSKAPPLAADTQAKLFSLFLNGRTTEEIRQLNPQFSLGQIVHARLVGEWDRRLTEHLDSLLQRTSMRFQQVQLESINFVSDWISAANKQHGEKIAKYLQTGDAVHLQGIEISSLNQYKTAIELLQTLTGQSRTTKSTKEITVKTEPAVSAPTKAIDVSDPEVAASILRKLASEGD